MSDQEEEEKIKELKAAIDKNFSAWNPKNNIFDILGKSEKETSYSRVLAWLLNHHGFAKYLFRQGEFEKKKIFYQYKDNAWDSVSAPANWPECFHPDVYTEVHTYNDKSIDILGIDNDNKLILCIENKVKSVLQQNQLEEYSDYLRFYKGYTVIALYLKQYQKGKKKEELSRPWFHISYVPVVRALEKRLAACDKGSYEGTIIQQFMQVVVRTLMMPDKVQEDISESDIACYNELKAKCKIYTEKVKKFYSSPSADSLGKSMNSLVKSMGFTPIGQRGGCNFRPTSSVFKEICKDCNDSWAYQLQRKDDGLLLKLTIIEAKGQPEQVVDLISKLIDKNYKQWKDCTGKWPRMNELLAKLKKDKPKDKKGFLREKVRTMKDFVVWQEGTADVSLCGFEYLLNAAAAVEEKLQRMYPGSERFEVPAKSQRHDDLYQPDFLTKIGKAYQFYVRLIKAFGK